jgi:Fic family protein
MNANLLPFGHRAVSSACADLDRWHERLSWKDWHGRAWTGRLRRDVEAEAVAASTRMEGVPVTVEEVRRILAGDRPAEVTPANARLVEGYRDALRFAQNRADDPAFRWNGELIVGLHDRVLAGDTSEGAGRFADRPRYVAIHGAKDALFEPPAAATVPALVDDMCARLNEEHWHPGVAAAWVHVATAAIHPFRDGNGRCARVLASLAMYRGGFRLWAFTTLESWWGNHREDYYGAFTCLGNRFDPSADVTPFIVTHINAQLSQVRALDLRDRVEHRVWEAVIDAVEDVGLDERVANALWEAFFERDVTAGYYRAVTDVSPATATHDLRAAVAAGLLSARGERRGRRYLPGSRLYELVGRAVGLEGAAARAQIIGALAQRIAAEAAVVSAPDPATPTEGSVVERRVDVRHLQLGRDALLDYEIEVRDDGSNRGVIRASLSPEAWMRLGTVLGLPDWHIPSGLLTGDAAKVAEAFVDVIIDIIIGSWPPEPGEIKVASTDEAMIQRIAERAREHLAARDA